MDPGLLVTVFVTIFLVELPDKTFIATLVLATRYRPLLVWLGVCAAFLVQTVVAVAFGGLIGRLPEKPVHAVVMVLFAIAAFLLIRSARDAAQEEAQVEAEFTGKATAEAAGFRAFTTSFLILFLAEWGDLSQLATAGFVAKNGGGAGVALSVGVGAFVALATVSGLAVLLGRKLLDFVPLSVIRLIGGLVCALFAILLALQLLGVDLPSWLPV